MIGRVNARAAALIAGVLVSAMLVACGGEAVMERPQLGTRSERRMYGALDAVNATDAERGAVLKIYDASAQRMKGYAQEWNAVVREWRRLERTSPDFPAQLQALSARWATVNGQEMQERGTFEHDVSAQLTAAQWQAWQAYMKRTEPYDVRLREQREREREREG